MTKPTAVLTREMAADIATWLKSGPNEAFMPGWISALEAFAADDSCKSGMLRDIGRRCEDSRDGWRVVEGEGK
jgi:hypothetical protein